MEKIIVTKSQLKRLVHKADDVSNESVVDEAKKLLANTFTLYFKTHSYHWNIVGSRFVPLHSFLSEQYTELWNAVDTIAERVRSLDSLAPAMLGELTKYNEIKEIPTPTDSNGIIKDLLTCHITMATFCKKLFTVAEQSNDIVTMDLATQRSTVHEKTIWMLKSLLKNG